MRIAQIAVITSLSIAAMGCHSALISATIANHSATPVDLVELDYPSASFGVQNLAPGEAYHYRFKVLGHGAATLLWTDSASRSHKSLGPVLQEGDEGTLSISLEGRDPVWDLHLANRSAQ